VSYFDIEKGAYTTLTTQGYKIHVDKGNVDKNYAQQLDQRAKYKNMDIEDDLSLSIFGKERHIFDNPIIYFIPFIFTWLYLGALSVFAFFSR
jgi:hypothetical protein